MRRWATAVCLFSAGAFAASASAQDLQRLVAAAEALGARTGVAVADGAGNVLFRHRATEAFAPASNMKVLTATAVLQGLGVDHEFATVFRLRGGNLVVTASGDPNWIRGSVHDSAAVFARVAAELRALGVRSVGAIDLDAGTFVGPGRPSTWPADQLETYYCAPTGPFVLEQGTFAVRITAQEGGQASALIEAPVVDMPLRGAIAMVASAKGATYGASDRGDSVLVRGKFPRRAKPVTIRGAVADPAVWFRAALQKGLADGGITVGVAANVADREVLVHRSDLRQAVLRMLEDSSNFDAEQCLRVLSNQRRNDGSLAGGVLAMHDQIVALLGRVPDGVVIADGSGLSKQSRVTPGLLLTAMARADATPVGPVLRGCLPIAGRSGTLEGRFRGSDLVGRVRAKTGWIRGASSLSGVLERRDGSVRWFSILMNYDPKQDGLNKDLKRLQEEIVQALDRTEG